MTNFLIITVYNFHAKGSAGGIHMNLLQNLVLSSLILLSSTTIFNTNHVNNYFKTLIYENSNPEISIVFAGDTMMDWSIKDTVKTKGTDYPFRYVKEEVTASDYAVVNLETAVTNHTDIFSKEYNFKSDPISLQGLKNAGFDLISLANNHTMDYEKKGLMDTMNHINAYDMSYIGAGSDTEEAYKSKEVMIKGKKFRFLAFSRVLPSTSWVAGENSPGLANGYSLDLIEDIVRRESKLCDYLMIYMHWGKERSKHPEPYQVTYARTMIDAGADAIIGSHPHVLQGFQHYKGKPIAYSLGNFLFPDYVKGNSAETGLLKINIINEKMSMQFKPYYIKNDMIIKLDPDEEKRILAKLENLSYQIKLTGYDFK
jgi:poly-gamma-glutamate capsule biosynthesis protein CapA/YwtB (metallophosphatase superfamily)